MESVSVVVADVLLWNAGNFFFFFLSFLQLVGPLLRGCPHLSTLNLSHTTFTHKRTKDAVIPVAWKQFFASTCSLQFIDLSATRLPCDAVK